MKVSYLLILRNICDVTYWKTGMEDMNFIMHVWYSSLKIIQVSNEIVTFEFKFSD